MGDMASMMGGAGGDFGGIDFSKLGGAGMGGEEEDEGEGEDDDDEEMPALDGDEEASEEATSGKTGASATKTASGGKIEEIA